MGPLAGCCSVNHPRLGETRPRPKAKTRNHLSRPFSGNLKEKIEREDGELDPLDTSERERGKAPKLIADKGQMNQEKKREGTKEIFAQGLRGEKQ